MERWVSGGKVWRGCPHTLSQEDLKWTIEFRNWAWSAGSRRAWLMVLAFEVKFHAGGPFLVTLIFGPLHLAVLPKIFTARCAPYPELFSDKGDPHLSTDTHQNDC